MPVGPVGGKTATLLVMTALCGCGHAPATPDLSDGWGPTGINPTATPKPPRRPAPRARLIPEDERTRWQHADAIAALTPIGARAPSEHIDGRHERTVLINETAASYTCTDLMRPPPARISNRRSQYARISSAPGG